MYFLPNCTETDPDDIWKELEQPLKDPFAEEQYPEVDDPEFFSERKVESRARRLNKVERQLLLKAFKNTTLEVEALMKRAVEDGCNQNYHGRDKDKTKPAAASADLAHMDACAILRTNITEMRMRKTVLKGIKIVDDEIRGVELNLVPEERRTATSFQITYQLRSIAKTLRKGARQLAKAMREENMYAKAGRTDVISPCYNNRDISLPGVSRGSNIAAIKECPLSFFSELVSTQALQFGKTIQLSAESDDGFSCSASGNVAYTYGPNGEFGCATTTCSGWGNNTCITPGVSGGFFNDFEDVDGPYVIQVFSASLRSPISGSIGIIESFDGRQIGWVIGVLADSNLMPFDVAAMSCRATMVRPERDGKKTKQTVKASVRVEPIHHHAVYLFVLQRKRTV